MKRIVFAMALFLALTPRAISETRFAPMTFMSLRHLRPWAGDFDGMLKRHAVRILVPYSKTLFFIDRGRQLGVEATLGGQFDDWLNANNKSGGKRINIWFVPVPRDELLRALIEGRGDIAAGNLTITPDGLVNVDFAEPWRSKIDEIVVAGPSGAAIGSLEDLAGREVFARTSGSVWEHLRALNEDFRAKGLRPIRIKAADDNLEDEDILEMINAGLVPLAVVDEYTANFWLSVFSALKPRHDLIVSRGGAMAWAIRKNAPMLKIELAAFVRQHPLVTAFGGDIPSRYGADGRVLRNVYADADMKRFDALVETFKSQAAAYRFDWRMLMAQGYQESRLDQTMRSPRGAVGVMQVMPSTAASKPFGVTGVDRDVTKNVQAGAAILRYLADTVIGDDAAVGDRDRMLFAFAAYNAGQGSLAKFRDMARRQGLNPNVWFGNVEITAGQLAGAETVQYVSNIYRYFIAYALLAERMTASRAARAQTFEIEADKSREH